MSWQDLIQTSAPVWRGVEGYIAERVHELTAVCTSRTASDAEIRAAQAGIEELQRLQTMPHSLQASATDRAKKRRREY